MLLAVVMLGVPAPLLAQGGGLAQRVAGAPEGRVQFSFAARPGVCGNGRSFIQTGPNSFSGSWSDNDGPQREACVAGPVRVVLDRAAGNVLSVQTYVGPPAVAPGSTDLGTVRAQDAVDYLLDLARRAEGRAGRETLLPAMLADSANVTPALVAIAKDQSLPRETRRGAMSWLGRATGDEATIPAEVPDALLQVARDESDNVEVRRAALGSIARLAHGAGIPPLMELARANLTGDRTWLSKESLSALARSGDPRAREFLRSVVQRSDVPDEVMTTAIRGLGGEYATPRDAELLRGIYPKLTGDRSREAVLASVADIGGAENTRWLLSVARDESTPSQLRRRALSLAARAGVSSAELAKMYDATSDQQLKESLVEILGQSGDRAATDKLMAIARSEQDPRLRRRTIAQLSRSEDPRVKELLKELIEK